MYVLKSKHVDLTDDKALFLYLRQKGIDDPQQYINSPKELESSLFGECIDEAVQLLYKHIEKKSRILVIVDSDMDGVFSACMMINFLKENNIIPEIQIHEKKHHGIEIDKVPTDIDFVIAPDCSSDEQEIHQELVDRGVEVLVIDHHPFENFSTACTMVNVYNSEYPNKHLSGGGVVLKVLQHYAQTFSSKITIPYDLAASAIIADMMPLNNMDNRAILFKGLSNIQNKGLAAIIQKQSFLISDIYNPTPKDIAWSVAPLINATIRIGTMPEKELMINAFIDPTCIIKSTKRGAKVNDTEITCEAYARVASNVKARQEKLKKEISNTVEGYICSQGLNDFPILIIKLGEVDNFDNSLNGLIANGLLTAYNKPVMFGRIKDGTFKGSLRGAEEFFANGSFKQTLNETNLFNLLAGHDNACGFEIKEQNLPILENLFDKITVSADQQNLHIYTDFMFDIANVEKFSRQIQDFASMEELWGCDVEIPTFVIKNVPKDAFTEMKNKGSRAKIGNITFVRFKDEEFLNLTGKVNVCGEIKMNWWNGIGSIQFIIQNYEVVDEENVNFDF